MKDINKELKTIKTVSIAISILAIVIGFLFSYIIAETQDAPGFVLIGSTVTLVGAAFIYGLGEIVISLKKTNMLLSEIKEKLQSKNK